MSATVDDVLSLLDEMNEQGRIEYADYSRLHDAIAATLGRPTFNANLEQALSFMRIWISEDAHLGESELSAAFEKAEGLRKLDAIESAIAATLGSGKLKAEQVEKVIMSSDYWERVNNHPALREGVWQAIADELNASLGGSECGYEARGFAPFRITAKNADARFGKR